MLSAGGCIGPAKVVVSCGRDEQVRMRILMAYRSLPHRIAEFAYGWNEHLQNGKPPKKKKKQAASASESDSGDDEEDESEAEPPAKKQKK